MPIFSHSGSASAAAAAASAAASSQKSDPANDATAEQGAAAQPTTTDPIQEEYSQGGANGANGATLSTTSSYSSFGELDNASISTNGKKKDQPILSRSNSVSAKLKNLFHKSPQNSSLHIPLPHKQQPIQASNNIAVDRLPSPRVTDPQILNPLSRSTSSTSVAAKNPQSPTGTASPLMKSSAAAGGGGNGGGSPQLEPSLSNSSTASKQSQSQQQQEMKRSPSNSELASAISKLKLAMPPVIENDLDDVLEQAERNNSSNTTAPSGNKTPSAADPGATALKQPQVRGRITSRMKPSLSGSDTSIGSRSRSASRKRDNSTSINNPGLPKEILDKLRTTKHHREGNLIVIDEGVLPHIHDFSKLKKDPIQTSPSGILSSLLGVKKKEVNHQDHLHDMKLEDAVSLLPDNYSEELIMFKSKPENYLYNYEEYLYGSGSDSEYETDSDYDSDEDIDPIIGDAQLEIINKLVEKIEHIDKYKERLVNIKKMKLVEKYGRIQGVVGRGSFGVVKLTVKLLPNKTQRIFAVKELKQKSNENLHHFSNRLTSEFMISSSLTHQSIINTYDLMVDLSTNTYLQVMDYVPCGDLFSLVQSSNGEGLHPMEADCFFKQILNAISYLHSVGISHNDLKVENLLLTATGLLKIIDFGTSTPVKCAWEQQCSKLSGPQGSEPYCGPEMFVQKDYDPRLADIWSLGVIYLVMMNGGYVWKIANAKTDSTYMYFLESRPQNPGEKGSFDVIEELQGSNKVSKRKVLYSMLDPNPSTRIGLKEIWKSKWVANIEVCDAGQGYDPVLY